MAMVSLEAAVRTRYRPARVARPAKEARPSLEDAEVIRRVRAGDTDAFGVLVDRYGARITRLVRGFVRNEEDARDVTQESFLKAFARALRYACSRDRRLAKVLPSTKELL